MTVSTAGACGVLEIPVGSRIEDVRAAYRRKLLQVHPDKGGDAASFRKVQQAWHFLQLQEKLSARSKAAAGTASAAAGARPRGRPKKGDAAAARAPKPKPKAAPIPKTATADTRRKRRAPTASKKKPKKPKAPSPARAPEASTPTSRLRWLSELMQDKDRSSSPPLADEFCTESRKRKRSQKDSIVGLQASLNRVSSAASTATATGAKPIKSSERNCGAAPASSGVRDETPSSGAAERGVAISGSTGSSQHRRSLASSSKRQASEKASKRQASEKASKRQASKKDSLRKEVPRKEIVKKALREMRLRRGAERRVYLEQLPKSLRMHLRDLLTSRTKSRQEAASKRLAAHVDAAFQDTGVPSPSRHAAPGPMVLAKLAARIRATVPAERRSLIVKLPGPTRVALAQYLQRSRPESVSP